MEEECCFSISGGSVGRSPPSPASASAARGCPVPRRPHGEGAGAAGEGRQYRGVRMRKWGRWVAEIREPNKRSRIWLGSYATPVAAARAYDTAVFYLRGRSARLNFPDELPPEDDGAWPTGARVEALSAASIRKKAAEVGAQVDAFHRGTLGHRPLYHQHRHNNSHERHQNNEQRQEWRREKPKYPDLNRQPSPESSDNEE